MDKAEAYRSYEMVQRLTWLMIGIVILGLAAILGFREARLRNMRRIEALQQSVRARRELLAVVSHDLKNPLGALLMINEILLRSLPPDLDVSGKRRALLERSHRVAEQMRRLITDLLDSAKFAAGKLEIHPIECAGYQVLDQTLEVLEPIAAPKELRLTRALPADLPALWADPERVAQVFSNLLGNAVKFTERGGEISIRAELVDDWVQFSVRDTGPGIPEAALPHLFERYWQAKDTRDLGTGLGLAICNELIAAHGGRIWVESKLGVGTVFHFTLPTVRAAHALGLSTP